MSLQQQLSQSASLLSAVDAVRNWKAAALLLVSLLLAGIVFALGGFVSVHLHVVFGAVFFLLSFAVYFYGINATGIMLMDEAHGSKSRSVLDAVMTALSVSHRVIFVFVLVAVIYFLGALCMALLLLICKIPGLGPLLFAFVFPICVVVSGVAIFASYAVFGPLAAPAVWSGASTLQVVSRLAAIARERIVVVILSVLVLLLICSFVAGIIFGIIATGTLITGGMSAGIIGVSGVDFGSVMGVFGSAGRGFARSGDSGHVAAGAFGWGIVLAVGFTLPFLVYLRGCCQIYLASIQGIDVGDMEQQFRGTFDAAKRGAADLKAKGEALAAQQSQRFEKPASAQTTPAVASAPQYKCAACGTPYLAGDVFCGGCGQKLA